jgi:hypothetical protein
VHEENEDVNEKEGVEGVGEQQEEEEGNSEGDETSRGYVITGFVDEGETNPEVTRQYERESEDVERALEEDSLDNDYVDEY